MSSLTKTIPPRVSCWTKLTIPTSRKIEDRDSEDGRKWILASTHLGSDKIPGFMAQCFGRMIEFPDTVWYITAWDSCESLDDYEKSEDYRLQREEYAKFSSTALEVHRCDVEGRYWQYITQNVGFIDAYFPASISDESKQIVNGACGLRYRYGPEGSAYKHRPIRGWLHGTRNYYGQDAVVVRFWHFWKSQESERHFRVIEGVNDPQQEYYAAINNQFMDRLKKAGVLGIREFHCSLVRLWGYYIEPREDDDEEHPSDDDPSDGNEGGQEPDDDPEGAKE